MNILTFWRAIAIVCCFYAFNASAQPMIFLPFSTGTEVYCSQGNNGSHSHSGSLRYAYDFTFPPGDGSIDGEPVYSPVNGYVAEVVRNVANNSGTGWGNTIVIQTIDGYRVRLAHLRYNSIPSALKTVGAVVEQGDRIGSVGATGNVTGPHLHLEVTTRTSSQSIYFDFVEGPVSTGTTIESDLRSDRYIIDNTGRVNLGAPLVSSGTSSTGTYSNYSWTDGAHLTNYRGTSTSGAQFNWRFSTSFSGGASPTFTLSANCPYNSSRDTATRYTISRSNGSNITRTIDQRTMRADRPAQIGSAAARTNTSFTVNARRGNNRMCADSIVIDVDW